MDLQNKRVRTNVKVRDNFMNSSGGVLMLETEVAKRIRCFVCGERMPVEEIVVVSLNEEDMVCVCKGHIRAGFRVPVQPSANEESVGSGA